MTDKVIIKNIRVAQNNKSEPLTVPVDVGIRDGVIRTIGDIDESSARNIDGEGNWLLPGFIDLHSHSDYSLLEDPRGISKLSQGVTTEVPGNCSMGISPIPRDRAEILNDNFSYLGADPDDGFADFGDYTESLGNADLSLNVAPLVGHGCLRLSVMDEPDRPASDTERDHIQSLLRDCLQQGAVGCSLGLMYEPSRFANTEELLSIARVLADEDSALTVHLRNEGWRAPEALEEILSVVRQTGIRTQVSHLKSAGPTNSGTVLKLIDMIGQVRDEGYDVTADMYPYTAGSTTLTSLLPEEHPDSKSLDHRMTNCEPDWPGSFGPGALPPKLIELLDVDHPNRDDLEGQTLREIADDVGQPPWETARTLCEQSNREPIALMHLLSEGDVDAVYNQSWSFVASDGNAISPDSRHADHPVHPRYYGTFPRFIREWVLEREQCSIPDLIQKTSAGPARLLGMNNRGSIEPGNRADLVLLNPDRIKDRATYEDSHRLSEGIQTVLVNGEPAWNNGEVTDNHPGTMIS